MSEGTPTTSDVPASAAPLRRYHNYPLDQLWGGLVQLKANAADMKAEVKLIDEELQARFGVFVAECFAEDEKLHGQLTVFIPAEPKFSLKAEISKKVVWDSGMLEGIVSEWMTAGKLTWEQVQKLCKIEFSISEKVYSALEAANPELKKAVDDARTVIYGDAPKLTLMRAAE